MSLTTAAARGFVIVLLSVKVIQGGNDWGVTYTSTNICALEGSTVKLHCSYKYPSTQNGRYTTVQETFWVRNVPGSESVELRKDSEYSGRVQETCSESNCTLTITDLRRSDTAEYRFRIITNQPGERDVGSPGVTLSVTDLQVQVTRISRSWDYTEAELKCHSSCRPAGPLSYIWFKNDEQIKGEQGSSYTDFFNQEDVISCALGGDEKYRSPLVYAPKLPSVSVSPAEIEEGRSVTLTCSSEANPAAKYTWYKDNGLHYLHPPSKEPQLVFSSIKPSDSGKYECAAENELGERTSEPVSVIVKSSPLTSALIPNIIRLTLVVLMLIPLLLIGLWLKKKMKKTEPNEPIDTLELKTVPDYINISDDTAPQGRRLE